jgi:hypothetical protein
MVGSFSLDDDSFQTALLILGQMTVPLKSLQGPEEVAPIVARG